MWVTRSWFWFWLLAPAVLITGCGKKAPSAPDTVRLTNGGSGANGILLDGKESGKHRNDLTFTGPAGVDLDVGVITFSNDSNEIIAFTNGRAPTLAENVPWTRNSDIVPVAFADEYRIPVFVWIVWGSFAGQNNQALSAGATAAQIWADEGQGIAFSNFDVIDETGNPNASLFYDFTCANQHDIKTQIGFNATGVNIYYVSTVDFDGVPRTTTGVHCNSTGIIAIGQNTSTHLLAHELGHAFAIQHVNSLTTFFDTTNVMHNASNDRQYLTEGQTFRVITGTGSVINALYNARPGLPTRNCGNSTSTTLDACPAVQKRIWADGANWWPN